MNVIVKNNKVTAKQSEAAEAASAYEVSTNYQDNINMYNEPPQNIISLHEFSKLALDRLQVLKKIEFMYDSNSNDEQLRNTVNQMTRKHRIAVEPKIIYDRSTGNNISSTLKSEERGEYLEKDNISHFICRLAYCRNEELRKWFIT